MKPRQVSAFLWALFVLMGLTSLVFPKEGIQITKDYTLNYPNLASLFTMDTVQKKDFSKILENDFDIDSLELRENQVKDSIRQALEADSIRKWQLQLHYPNEDKSILYSFFQTLDAGSAQEPIRIMHYGDSQIEADRISGYLRYKLQGKFGGIGPGLIPSVPLVRSAAFRYESSENWKRYTLYGIRDSLVQHKKYGPLGSFGRYTEIISDSIMQLPGVIDSLKADSSRNIGWLSFKPSNIGYPSAKKFNQYQMMFGNHMAPVKIKVVVGDSIIQEKKYNASESMQLIEGSLKSTPKEIKFLFEGVDSPDVYAINLTGKGGIAVDNIAWRGSSGTIFRRMDRQLLSRSLKEFNTELLLLQFGGNVMPYIKNKKECENYGKWFESQLILLKQLVPNADIIVIGPSDMGIYENQSYNSYPLLPTVRDALKAATFRQGGAYWDMMEAMGGTNSMEAWVNSNPPLAVKDYVHFNMKGAQKVAQMFYNALIQDYNEYKNR